MSESSRAALEEPPREREPDRNAQAAVKAARVSIVIPARNEAAYIAAALASVAAQIYPMERLECVVVDNGSTDATARIANDFAAAHPHLTVTVVAEPTPGVARAKNRGARRATGNIVFFLDADSRMAPNLVRDIVARWRAGSPAGCIRVVADSNDPLERGFSSLMEVGPVLFGVRSQMPYCESALFHTLGGFQEDLHLAEDLEFLRRVREHLRQKGQKDMGTVCHIRTSAVATSPRRLRTRPLHLNIALVFVRWALAFAGIGRKRDYRL